MGPLFRRALRPVWYRIFPFHPYHYLGAFLWAAMGGDERQRMSRVFEKAVQAPLPFRTRCLLYYLDNSYYARHAGAASLSEPNRLRWGGPYAVASHLSVLENYARTPGAFERDYEPVLNRLRELLRESSFDYVVELGCGNGLLAERLPALAPDPAVTIIGMDISPQTVAFNRERYNGSRVQYLHDESLQSLLGKLRPSSALIVAVSTFELFTENELLGCLRWLTANVPHGALVSRDFTFSNANRQPHSRPGGSFTFFHNYELLFQAGGLTDIRTQVVLDREPDWKAVVISGSWGS